ncbi:MAG TPA: ATP-binding protein [Humisphaera sp.]|nr:ATP-binding protein [Humisphaera sp.]
MVGAVLAVGLGLLTRALLWRVYGIHAPYLPFVPWILVAAFFCGGMSGLIALIAFAVIGALSPTPTMFVPTRSPTAGLILFVSLCLLGIAIIEWTNRLRAGTLKAISILRESETTLRLALEAGGMGTFDWTMASDAVVWSPSLARLRGRAPGADTRTREAALSDVHPGDLPRLQAAIQGAIASKSDYQIEYRVVTASGDLRWVESRGRVICDDRGTPMRVTGVCMDITERKRAEETLHRERELLQAIFDRIPVMLTIYEAEAKKIRLNPFFQQTTGWTAQDGVDGALMEKCYPNPEERKQAAQFMAACQGWMDFRMRTREGRDIETSWANIRLSDQSQVGIGIDITERKRAEEALRDADRRKDEFLATLAHELRNPLAPVQNALETLKRAGSDTALAEDARAMMERQVRHMARLIDDLMDISRITRGKLSLRRQKTDVAAVIRAAADSTRTAFADKSQELRIELPDEPLNIDADPVRLEQAIGNLLNNASKYTDAGGQIHVSAARDGQDAVIRVKDNGIGIAPDMLPRVFDLFTQAERSLERAAGGLGIGLSLVKGLVELHGGTVNAHSDGEGRGSEFVIRLAALAPASDESPEAPPTRSGSIPKTSGHGRRILVVDDNRDAARSMAVLLKLAGHETQIATDGEEALAGVQSFAPDAVLLDIGLPKLNGYDACRAIRQMQWPAQPIIIALTGWGQEEDRRRSTEAGFDAHVVKPVELPDLLKLLETLFAKTDAAVAVDGATV